MRIDYIGLSFSAILIFVTLLKDNVHMVSYTLTECRSVSTSC